jgi:hypothetical protein
MFELMYVWSACIIVAFCLEGFFPSKKALGAHMSRSNWKTLRHQLLEAIRKPITKSVPTKPFPTTPFPTN